MPIKVEVKEDTPMVKENRNKVVIKCGPTVYCLESPDLTNGPRVNDVVIPSSIKLASCYAWANRGISYMSVWLPKEN